METCQGLDLLHEILRENLPAAAFVWTSSPHRALSITLALGVTEQAPYHWLGDTLRL